MLNFYIAAFLADLALGAVLLSLPLLLIYKFDATSLTLGLLGALGAFIYSFGVLALGRLSDRFNRKHILIFGCFLFILSYSTLPYFKNIEAVFLVYIFGSISMSMFWPTIQSWLSQGLDKENLVKSLTGFNVCWSAGLTLGFLSAGFLFYLNQKAPFIFGVFLVAMVILLLKRQAVVSEVRDEPARKVFLETERMRPESAREFLGIGWCANFASWYVVGTVRNLFPKLGTELGFSSGVIGIFVFLLFLTQTVMFFILGRTSRWHYRLLPIVLFQILSILALSALVLTSAVTYFVFAMVFLGLSNGMTYFSSIFYSLYGFIDKGRKSGYHEAFLGTGTLFGPLVGGFVAYRFGIRAPYVAAALLLVTAIAAELILFRKRHS